MSDDLNTAVIKETIKQIAKPVQDFVKKVSGPPAKELGNWMADGIRGYRFNTQLKIYTSAMKQIEEAGLNPERVNLKILVPLLETGSLEEDASMVDMWASLLANAATKGTPNVSVSFPSILREINSSEAKILEILYQEANKSKIPDNPVTHPYIIGGKGEVVRLHAGLTSKEFEQYVDNLYRLRVLAPPSTRLEFIDKNRDTPFMLYTKKTICLTYLGYDFMEACHPPVKQI